MKKEPIDVTEDGILLCPLCKQEYTHVDDVHVGGRPTEDGAWSNVHVDSAGQVREQLYDGEMALPPHSSLRRHYFTLLGNCEQCGGRFAIHFTQHKGQTFVSASRPAWVTINPD